MSIKYAILGLLSLTPLTGYDLKKKFVDSAALYWSGNSNQIYKTLVELHQAGSLSLEVQLQNDKPPRKIYTITEAGLAELRAWVSQTPELPQVRSPFLIQLMWADALTPDELDDLLNRYEEEVQMQILMLREKVRRTWLPPARTPREALLRESIDGHSIAVYEHELAWLRDLRDRLKHGT